MLTACEHETHCMTHCIAITTDTLDTDSHAALNLDVKRYAPVLNIIYLQFSAACFCQAI